MAKKQKKADDLRLKANEFFILNKTKKKNQGEILHFIPEKIKIDKKTYKIKKPGFRATGMVMEKDGSAQIFYKKKK